MSQAIRESFMKISSLFEEQDAATTDIPFVKYPDYENPTEENIRMVIGFKSAKLLQRINANRYKTTETSIVFYSLTNME